MHGRPFPDATRWKHVAPAAEDGREPDRSRFIVQGQDDFCPCSPIPRARSENHGCHGATQQRVEDTLQRLPDRLASHRSKSPLIRRFGHLDPAKSPPLYSSNSVAAHPKNRKIASHPLNVLKTYEKLRSLQAVRANPTCYWR